MRQDLMFKDGTLIDILNESVLEPSGNAYIRNKFQIHVGDGDLAEFMTLFADPANLDEMLFTGYNDDNEIIYQHHIYYYDIVSNIGRKLFETVNSETGTVTSVYHLVVTLEQPTAAEREAHDHEAEEIMDILLGVEE